MSLSPFSVESSRIRGRSRRSSSAFSSVLALGALAIGALMSVATPADATVVVIHPIDEMAHRADVIVHAVVRDQRVKREDGRIVTLTDIEVLEGIKGAKAGDTLTIFQVGGKIDSEVVTVVGNSKFTPGEEMVYFAVRHRDRLVSYGVGVGKFSVDRAAGTVSIREEFGDVVAVDPKQPRAGTHAPNPRQVASLGALMMKIRTDLENPPPAQINRPRLKRHHKRLLSPRNKVLRRRGDAPNAAAEQPLHDHQ